MKPKLGLLGQVISLLSAFVIFFSILLAVDINITNQLQQNQLQHALKMITQEKIHQANAITESRNKNLDLAVSVIAMIAPNAILGYDFTQLELYIETITNNPEISYAIFFNNSGSPMAGSRTDENLETISRDISVAGDILGRIELGINPDILSRKLDEVEQRIAIFEQETSADIRKSNTLLFRYFIFFLGLCIFFLIVVVFIVRKIILPISQLSNWAQQVAQGDLTYQNIPASANEIGTMARSFEKVVNSFRSVAEVCEAVAVGNLNQSIKVRSDHDRLGLAVRQMVENFRAVVRQANTISNGDYTINVIPHSDTDELGLALSHMSKTLHKTTEEYKKALKEAQRLGTHLDNLPTPAFSIDANFHITYINPAGASLAGLTPGEALGRNCGDLFNTPICNTSNCPMRLAIKSNQVTYGETTICQRGQTLPVQYTTAAFRDKDGNITGGLESLIDISELKQAYAQSKTQNKLRSAQMSISDRLRGEQDEATICDNLLRELSQHIPFQIGMVYLADEGQLLRLCGSYAARKSIPPTPDFHFGEGITGQAALEERTLLLNQVPVDYVHIFSASGEALPRYILATPFLFEGRVKGVVELGSFTKFDSFTLELLDRVLENAAIVIHTAQSRDRVVLLLNQTQQQAEELQSQQEELQAGNEELREQTEALQKSENQLQQQAEELQSQQEELQVTNEELSERTEILENQQGKIKRKNEELARQRNELLQKTMELTTTNRYKSEFLANMSHELRTPLNSILILSQIFATNKEENLSEKQIEYARTINTSGTELLNLINEVLDLAKVEAGRMQLSIAPLNLQQFLTDMKESFAPVAADRGLTLITELKDGAPTTISTDSQKLLQIIKNLLSNSLKFTKEGTVQLQISRPPETMDLGFLTGQECVAISVIDSGIGIAADKQQIIFQAFQQVDGTISRKYGGTGLGLSIATELTTLLGGEIRLTSEIGHGSTFTVLLPESQTSPTDEDKGPQKSGEDVTTAPLGIDAHRQVSPPPQETTGDKPLEKHEVKDDRNQLESRDKTLLIVEDDPAFAQVLVDLAHERNFKCIIAEDGESGLHYADYYQPGAIILDIGLPGIDGWQVMDNLKKNPKTSHIPVHFMSAVDKSHKARQKGAIGYLTKPVSIANVHEALGLLEKQISGAVKKLLIVEDHHDQRSSMVELISDQHIEICAVATGNEAWQHLNDTSFDCMILDLGLEDMEGFKLLEMIKNDDTICNLPIIIYTGRDLNQKEEEKLRHYSASIIIKGAQSPERLLAETTLFLHQIEAELPEDKQQMLNMVHNREDIFTAKKVLVVDDDMRNVFALSSVLEEKGMEVLSAENGKKALDTLDATPDISLVLMDIMMPEMDGFEAMAKIRAQPRYQRLPIIALTAKAMKGDRHKCIEAGANDYLAKPVDINRLFSLLRVWLCQ